MFYLQTGGIGVRAVLVPAAMGMMLYSILFASPQKSFLPRFFTGLFLAPIVKPMLDSSTSTTTVVVLKGTTVKRTGRFVRK